MGKINNIITMKFSHSIVLAALLGSLSYSEVNAVAIKQTASLELDSIQMKHKKHHKHHKKAKAEVQSAAQTTDDAAAEEAPAAAAKAEEDAAKAEEAEKMKDLPEKEKSKKLEAKATADKLSPQEQDLVNEKKT